MSYENWNGEYNFMIKKVWAKFDGMNIECVCDEHHRKCTNDDCKEYVAKFIEIDRNKEEEETLKQLEQDASNLTKTIKKFESEVSKSLRKFKRI